VGDGEEMGLFLFLTTRDNVRQELDEIEAI
jgi:hypothetical protein